MDKFFAGKRTFAVVGASADPQKFGYKVLKWYKDRGLNVVPVNPRAESILGIKTVHSLKDVPIAADSRLSVSFITPPAVTKATLDSLDDNTASKIIAWFQPGTHDSAVLTAADRLEDNITDCILVKGDSHLKSRL